MSNVYIICLLLVFFSCKSKNENTPSDLNLYFKSTVAIDSIFISNITQDREFQFLPYSNPLYVSLNDSINDLYNINFYTENGLMMNQMWLDGKNITIKGSVSKSVKIDTVIGSDLFYKSINFKSNYKNLLKNHSKDSTRINSFLIEELKNNLENPLSIDIAEKFRFRNLNNKNELRKVANLLSFQNNMLKNHLLNPYAKIKNLISVKKIDFSKHGFYNGQKKLSQIELTNSKLYLIDFWFVDCPPCIKDHKVIKNKLKWLKEKNVELIGISTDNDYDKWVSYLNKENYEWINYLEKKEYDQRITTKLLINTFPTYLLIDNEGTILKRSNSFLEIEKHIEK